MILDIAKNALKMEIEGATSIESVLNGNFQLICEIIAKCQGKVIFSGVGKSGHICRKISSTMSSIGISSFFLHPSEASHGDLGMISQNDILILLSNSGETKEFSHLISFLANEKITSIGITRSEFSTLANGVNYKIILPAKPEIVSYNAPTTSTTQALIIGDLLAICASKIKGFGEVGYAKIHPGGKLGLSMQKISSIMRREIKIISENYNLLDAMEFMSAGFLCLENGFVLTDGDIRRAMIKHNGNLQNVKLVDISTKNPVFLQESDAVIKAVEIFNEKKIGTILIRNNEGKPVGIIDRKDIEF
jgi:KpsF/GutQ family protein